VYNIPRNIGGTSVIGTKRAANFYRSFLNSELNEMSSLKAVEATKIVENTFRDINIAFVNELAKSFDILGIDVLEVIKGASSKPFAFIPHYPGCGVGGHCIPVDPYYLIQKAKSLGFEHKFLELARNINNSMPKYTVDKLVLSLADLKIPLQKAKVGLLGLSYKANLSDLRESPALKIKELLEELGLEIYVFDPYVENYNSKPIEEILEICDAAIIATNHKDFLEIEDWKNIKLIIDGRNCLDKDKIRSKKIIYRGIGRS
jgi:nucleotide sugar dehydrogenase